MRRLLPLLLFLTGTPLLAYGSDWWLGGGGGGGLTGGIPPTKIHAPAAGGGGATLTLSDCSPAVITNRNRDGALLINLCNAQAGMEIWVFIENSAQDVTIEPNGAVTCDVIATPEVSGAGDGLDFDCNPSACIVGTTIHMISLEDNEWRVIDSRGTAGTDNGTGCGSP